MLLCMNRRRICKGVGARNLWGHDAMYDMV